MPHHAPLLGGVVRQTNKNLMRLDTTQNRCTVLLLVAVAAYFQTWLDLWPLWERKNATYTHGTLIVLIALWLVWRGRSLLPDPPASRPSVLALVLLGMLSFAWLLAARANILIAYALLWPVLAFVLLWAGSGWKAARLLAFPLGFLYFAIPVWDYLEPALQALSAAIVSALIGIAGTQASVDGPHILLPGRTIYIALTCSGAHFLSVSLAMGALAGELRDDRWPTRLLILCVAGTLSIAFNSLRILMIVLAYLHDDLRNGLETIGHLTFGWWVFAIDLLVFYLALRLVPASRRSVEPQSPPVSAASTEEGTHAAGKRAFAFAVVAALVLPIASWAAEHAHPYPKSLAAPIAMRPATRSLSPDTRWQPQFDGAAWEQRTAYISSHGRIIELYRNEYHDQSQGGELISHGAQLFDRAVFITQQSTITMLQRTNAPAIEINRVQLQDQAGRLWTSLFTYVIDEDSVASTRDAQLVTAWRSLYSRPVAGVFAVLLPCLPDCAAVKADLDEAAVHAYDAYERARREQ